jgi:hypothetical protein
VHSGRVWDAASGCDSPTAAFGHVCPILQPVLQPELPLNVSVMQQPVLPLDVSVQQTEVIRDTNRKKQPKQIKQIEFRFFSVQTENIFCLFRGHPIQNRDEEEKKHLFCG